MCWNSGMSDTTHRNSVSSKSFRSSKELIAYCKSIDQGWYRCQALASGAAKLEREECRNACKAAAQAAKTEKDQYRRVTPLAWPIRTLSDSGLKKEANNLLVFALKEADSITPSNSRAQTLHTLCQYSWHMDVKYRRSILKKLYQMIDSVPGWRIARACAWISYQFDVSGDSVFVDELLKNCGNKWLIGRVARDRAQRQANEKR